MAALGAVALAGGLAGRIPELASAGIVTLVGGTTLVAFARPARLAPRGRWGKAGELSLDWRNDRRYRMAKVVRTTLAALTFADAITIVVGGAFPRVVIPALCCVPVLAGLWFAAKAMLLDRVPVGRHSRVRRPLG
jgi:hypothetical protein